MPIQAVEAQRLYQQIAQQLRQLISSGEFPPGSRLPAERELASQLGVSRPSVREALIALEVEGWVEVRTGSGVYVLTRTSPERQPVAATEWGPLEVIRARRLVEGEIAVTIDKQKGVDVEFTSLEETLTVDGLLKSKVMQAKASALANQIDQDLHAETKKFFNWVGTPGTTLSTYAGLIKAPQRLDEMAVEQDGRIGVLPPADAWGMIGSLSGLTAQTKEATDALTRAKLPVLGNIDWYATQNHASVTTGTRSGDALIDGASQGTPADRAGLIRGDVLIKLGDVALDLAPQT